MAPTTVTLGFTHASSGAIAKAATDTTDLGVGDETDVGSEMLVLIYTSTYIYTAVTDVGDPLPKIVWERRTTGDVLEESLQSDVTEGVSITCAASTSTDTYELQANYDRDNGKRLHVWADNAHGNMAVSAFATLDVRSKFEDSVSSLSHLISESHARSK